MGFLMIPLTTLFDDYIDRTKLFEQKNPFEYIVHPQLKWVGTISDEKFGRFSFLYPILQFFLIKNRWTVASYFILLARLSYPKFYRKKICHDKLIPIKYSSLEFFQFPIKPIEFDELG